MKRKVKPIEDRFWAKVDKRGPDECWLWTGACNGHGYAHLGRGRAVEGNIRANRLSYILANGPISDTILVLHSCDNRKCVNPAHLFLGTTQDNVDDMVAKGRHYHGEVHHLAKLCDGDVRNIRIEYAKGDVTQQALADFFGVSEMAVNRIVNGKSWSHVQ